MYNFKSLKCYNCNLVILSLSELEISRLNGLHFRCENCGHPNFLNEFNFFKSAEVDPLLNICSIESFI